MIYLKKYFWFVLVLVLSFWAIKPLFAPGLFPMHDDTQVARIFEMGKVLRSGTFPVRWVPDLGYGYGYPIFNFYAPFAYYVGGFFTLLGIDALVATKVTMGIGIILSAVFMYVLAKSMWGKVGGAVSALFYMYAPYHAIDIYVRGDVAEFWAYAFIPLVFYGVLKLKERQAWQNVVTVSLGYSGLILSHNLTALMATPFLVLFIFLNKKIHALSLAFCALLIGLLISAFYWLPALSEMKYTNVLSQIGGGADFRDHFVCIDQLWSSAWGFGGSVPGCVDGLSFKIGKLHILASLFSLLLFITFIVKKKKTEGEIFFFMILGFLVSIFLMLEVAKPIWEAIPFMAFLQYPWRFLLLTSFFSSLFAGSISYLLKIVKNSSFSIKKEYVILFALIITLLYFNTKLFVPQTILYKNVYDFTSDYELKWTASKTSDEYLPKNVKLPRSYEAIPRTDFTKNSMSITVKNHKKLFEVSPIQLSRLQFEETNVERIANIISIIGIVALITGIITGRKRLS